jgi:hypothetical protein
MTLTSADSRFEGLSDLPSPNPYLLINLIPSLLPGLSTAADHKVTQNRFIVILIVLGASQISMPALHIFLTTTSP